MDDNTVYCFDIFFLYSLLFSNESYKLIQNFNREAQDLTNTVSLGVRIALNEQNFEGVVTALNFLKDDPRLRFVSIIEADTIWNENKTNFQVSSKILRTYPETAKPQLDWQTNDTMIVKHSPFVTKTFKGEIISGFSTVYIKENIFKLRLVSMLVSAAVFLIGLLVGLWLAKNISDPIMRLSEATNAIGQGRLDFRIASDRNDELGKLGVAFNNMAGELEKSRAEITAKHEALKKTNETLHNTLDELKRTQTQLIHSEKMASLGELTAGIAHEIQNPLNFVNNFSELSGELLIEMKENIEKKDFEEVNLLADDVIENLSKIAHHGKRADSIVKGMLQHSRKSSDVKEFFNINELTDEYAKLSYHGMRAKDKSFNAALNLDLAADLPPIKILPQDIGRVILNIMTNAFYVVDEKSKQSKEKGIPYQPTVSVTTRQNEDHVLISITDNGSGIPPQVMEKLFQPFFTTKPTNKGTGLGLSLSYDIVTKGHNGKIDIETKVGEGTTFIIQLPITTS